MRKRIHQILANFTKHIMDSIVYSDFLLRQPQESS
jgi:hypothetical protein